MNNNYNRNQRFRNNRSTNFQTDDVKQSKTNMLITDDQVEDIIRSFNSNDSVKKAAPDRSSDDYQRSDSSGQPQRNASSPRERRFNPNDESVSKRQLSAMEHTQYNKDVTDTDVDKGRNYFKILALGLFLFLFTWLLPSANVMDLAPASLSLKDRDTFFMSTSGDLLSNVLSDIHSIPRKYVLELSDVQTPAPDHTKFTQINDEVRQNFDGKPIEYYKDSTIEVKCWREKNKKTVINYSEVWIAHPSQLRRIR